MDCSLNQRVGSWRQELQSALVLDYPGAGHTLQTLVNKGRGCQAHCGTAYRYAS